MKKIIFIIVFVVLLVKPSATQAANLDNISEYYSTTTDQTISIVPYCGDNLQASGTTLVTGIKGDARYFNGQDEYLTGSDSRFPSGNSPVTITAWFRTSKSFLVNQFGIILFYGKQSPTNGIYLGVGSNNDISQNSLFISAHGNAINTNTPVNDNQWHHGAATFDGKSWKIYLDGIYQNSKDMDTNVIKQGTFYLGNSADHALPWSGDLDEVRIYDRALNRREIAFDMAQGIVNGAIGTWRMDETDLGPQNQNYTYSPQDYSFTPNYYDGGSIKNISFSCTDTVTNQTFTKPTKIVVFRDFSKLIKYSGNPIIDIDTALWNKYGVDAPYLHDYQQINGIYYAPLQVNDISMSPVNPFSWYNKIAVYSSSDLLNWQPIADNPVITNTPGAWDDHLLLHPSVIKIGNLWYMYYSALAPGVSFAQPYADPNWGPEQIGLATSPDFIHWTKHPNNPVYSGETPGLKHQAAGIPSVVRVGNKYYLYYHDRINDILKYAVSDNGINWTYGGETVKPKPGDWDHVLELGISTSGYLETCMDPFVINNSKGFYEAVCSNNYNNTQDLGTMLSEDGIKWYKYQGTILKASRIPGSYDEFYVGDAAIMEKNNKLYLYYAAVPKVGYKGTMFDLGLGALAYLEPDSIVPTSTPSPTPTPPAQATATPTPTPLPGDITGPFGFRDGKVNIYDYNLLITDFGKSGSPADIDGNGMIDIYDYNTLIGNFDKHN